MRITRQLAGAAVLAAAICAAAEPSLAQSLIQRLFGSGGSRTPEYRYGRMGAFGYSRRYDGNEVWEQDDRAYSTVCVRLCDGFYFPISYGVRRGRLYHDNRACMSGCDGEARLFYYPTQGGSVETMVDMGGRSYASLPNAFVYRKALVAGCTCKAAPWSGETAARHQGYAADEAYARAEAEVAGEDEAAQRRPRVSASAQYTQHSEAPRSYRPWPRYTRMPRTPWARNGLQPY